MDTPITDKDTEIGADPEKNMSYGLSAMQGWRSHMEDDHIQMLKLSAELQHLSLFGVFDGHGGEMARQRRAKGGPRAGEMEALGPAADGVGGGADA